MDEWKDAWMDEQMDRQIASWRDEWMNAWMDEQMDGLMDRQMDEIYVFCVNPDIRVTLTTIIMVETKTKSQLQRIVQFKL